jgi:GNAT superfamily N-acetyltransferase
VSDPDSANLPGGRSGNTPKLASGTSGNSPKLAGGTSGNSAKLASGTSSNVAIRPVRPDDVPAVVAMVHELADFERAPGSCHLTEDQLHAALFPDHPALFGHVAADPGMDEPIGYALWFLSFSTWEGRHGIYLEDLFVRPNRRGSGAGRALLASLADICVERDYARLEWWVLHWNPARDFYRAIGASAMDEWIPYRIEGEPLRALARHGRLVK